MKRLESVYERGLGALRERGLGALRGRGFGALRGRGFGALRAVVTAAALVGVAMPLPVAAQSADSLVIDAREAFRKKDRVRLAVARSVAASESHPLAMWVDYWELTNRMTEASRDEVAAFLSRWSGTYVEDRLRNDWLLELGRRREWSDLAAEFPRFRMNDDREVTCYFLLTEHLAGKDVRDAALEAWMAQREADDGCALMATTLVAAGRFSPADVWRKARLAIDGSRQRAARQAVLLVDPALGAEFDQALDGPARYLARTASAGRRNQAELTTLALVRMASSDVDAAALQLASRWERLLPPELAAWAWASVGKQSAIKLQPDASDHYLRASTVATKASAKAKASVDWSDEMLAWQARAALRADGGKGRWQDVSQAVNAMSAAEQRDPAWIYWKARALAALAKDSQDPEGLRTLSRDLLASLNGQMNFYATLAGEEAGTPFVVPPRPTPLTAAEIATARATPGLTRALRLIDIGLRSEGVREWNYTLRGMDERELLAAAQRACDREVWDRCINTSERTRTEIDMQQRFPTPFFDDVSARTREIGLDPAYVYGLIRQESRFIMDARSGAGASGLMQVMPATARWTAKRIGLPYTAALITDRDTNLRLGTAYLKLVLDDLGGSQALAAAAYNAGPGRPRRWREGPVLEPAAWAENIPFGETRDYVKKVLSNATYYAAHLGLPGTSLKTRLGRSIGPAAPGAVSDTELP